MTPASSKKPWTPERVAARLRRLAEEHGTPNRFQLHEVAGQTAGSDVLAVSRIAHLQWWAVNRHLQAAHLLAGYEVRQSADRPAYITVTATN